MQVVYRHRDQGLSAKRFSSSAVLFVSRVIQTMSEGLSDVALIRAWIHLALEKKVLSIRLKELLSDQELLR